MNRLSAIAAVSVALVVPFAGPMTAEAAVVDATYTGSILQPTQADPFDPTNQWPALSYGVSINESVLGGSMVGSTLSIRQYESGAGQIRTSNYSVEITGATNLSHSVTQTYAQSDFATTQAYMDAGRQTGVMFHDYLRSVGISVDSAIYADDIIASHDITLSFGPGHSVSGYSVAQSSEGGASQVGSQWLSNNTGDYAHWFWYGAFPSSDLPSLNSTNSYSGLPGSWDVLVHAPLPASAILMIGGLAALGGLGRIRRARRV